MAPTRLDPDDGVRRAAAVALVASAGLTTVGLEQAWAIFVVDDCGAPIGVSALERHGGSPPVYLLRSLAVPADRRGAGVGRSLVEAALAGADADCGGVATVGLLTETAVGYFERFGFGRVPRDRLPADLSASAELAVACAPSAEAYLRSSSRTSGA